MSSGAKRWRVFGLGVAFLCGCLIALLYNSQLVSGTVNMQQMVVDRNQNGDSHQNQNGDSHQNQNGDSHQNQNGDSHQKQSGDSHQNQNGDSHNKQAVSRLPQLEAAHFGTKWTEDQDLKNLRTYGVVENIPDMDVLNTYDAKKLSAVYHSYLDNNNILCHRKLRMGQVGDCGWEVCDDYEWRPIRPCIIYSFGINYEFSFDDDAGKIYGCDVYSFDPSMAKQPTYQRSDRVMFYRLGIGGQSGEPQKQKNGWVLHSLSNFRTMLNHTNKVIDVLKMDVESAEWPSLPTMLKERQLDNVRQFLVEYHQTSDDTQSLRTHLKIIGDLERAGFKKFYAHKNPSCTRKALAVPIKRTSCYEVHYVNAKFRRT